MTEIKLPVSVTEAMLDAALQACPLNYFTQSRDGSHYVRCSANTTDIRLMLTAALVAAPAPLTDEPHIGWRDNCQYLLDILDNQGFEESDLGEEDEGTILGIRADLAAAPQPAPFAPDGFRWIGRPCRVRGGDYEYEGRLLFSFPKDIGGPVRYVVMDQNRRLFIHNGRQLGLEESPVALDEAFFGDFTRWNLAAFGPGLRTEGTIKHIEKELKEIEADPTDPKEWVDIGILAFNGLVRLGLKPAQVIAAFLGKHAVNKARKWPDWRNHPDTPIEHDRSAE